jgi:Raf kinase inhibitor-like YbhB/YbcL family protein
MSKKSIHTEPVQAIDFKRIQVTSPSFGDGEMIPQQHTCGGKNFNPPLELRHIPEEAVCLALIAEDPDAPAGTWVHWVVWNIPVTRHIAENKIHGTEGMNDFGVRAYRGPCPPSGTHRYYFKLYALDTLLDLPGSSHKHDLEKAISGHILGFGQCMGRYCKG